MAAGRLLARIVFVGCAVAVTGIATSEVEARGGWGDIDYVYIYEAADGESAFVGNFNDLGCLDGEWRRSSNSDQWDGSTPDDGDGCPGGAGIYDVEGEGDGGGDASVLAIEDTGDPRPDPCNRKIYLWRDTTEELDLARGVTLVARWRLNPEPHSAEFENNGGVLPIPNGSNLHNSNKGQIGFIQKTGVEGTTAANLSFAITDGGNLQFAGPPDGDTPCAGLFYPDEMCFEIDPEEWVTVWLAVQDDGAGGLDTLLYLNGDTDPILESTLLGIAASSEDVARPEIGTEAASYIAIGLGATSQDAAIEVDYIAIADGFFEPEEENTSCPTALGAASEGADVVLTWTNRGAAPASVDVSRDGELIADDAPADTASYTDTAVPPGDYSYELVFDVPGQNCTLSTDISTCIRGANGVASATGVELTWSNGGAYEGVVVSREDVEIASLPGDAESYTDADPPSGTVSYTIAPSTGTCAAATVSLQYFPAPDSGDFNGETLEWSYSLDPDADANPDEYLLYEPAAGIRGDLDGLWTSGNGSDSWDGSESGEFGDPIADPASESPGGIGLVSDGNVGAYLIEDTGDPRDDGWTDPSNRKIYSGLGLSADVTDIDGEGRSLISDGVTIRARLRATPPERQVDLPGDAVDGYLSCCNGKGVITLVHDGTASFAGPSQRIGFGVDVDPDNPGLGLLRIGEGANELLVPLADPTEWLDVWLTVVDTDEDLLTPELSLSVYLNGSTEATIELDDYLPIDGGGEGAIDGVDPSNVLYMGMPETTGVGSMEIDLVCVIDDVVPPTGGGQQQEFRRGDANDDGGVNIADAVYMLNGLFGGGGQPPCREAAEINGDANYNIADAVYLLNGLFAGGPPPIDGHGPNGTDCGPDPNPESSLGCEEYTNC